MFVVENVVIILAVLFIGYMCHITGIARGRAEVWREAHEAYNELVRELEESK